jgi:hypothetical protein
MIETTCKGCVFAHLENEKQTGCDLERLEKLKFHRNEDGKSFTVERFCNTSRPKEWADSLSLEESLDLKKTVMTEVRPRIGVLIYFETLAIDPLRSLENTISKITAQEYLPRYIIVANNKVEYNEAIQKMMASKLPEDTEHHLVQMITQEKNKIEVIDECFRHALNGWMYITTSGESIPKNLMRGMNRIINEDMKKITVVNPYDGFNGMVFQTSLFKLLNGNRPKIWAVEEIDDRPFLEKAKDLDKDCKEKTIMSWEEFNGLLS